MRREGFLFFTRSHVSVVDSRPAARSSEVFPEQQAVYLRPMTPSSWHAVLASLSLMGVLVIASFWTGPILKGLDLAILYVLAFVLTGLSWGRRTAIVTGISGAVLFGSSFVLLSREFSRTDVWYVMTLTCLLMTGVLVSRLIVDAKKDALMAGRREAHTAALYSLTRSLAAESEPNRILDAVKHHIIETFHKPIAILLPTAQGLTVSFRSADMPVDEGLEKAAAWVFQSGNEAGCGTRQFPDSKIRYRPLTTGHRVVGVLGILANSKSELLSREQQELLTAFMSQAAMAITRADLAWKAQRAELLQEADKLQKALLNSVSHDLRTPLVSVIGGLNTVLQDAALLDAETQRALLVNARDEAVRLNRLIQNLLDMSRLEGGAILAKTEPCDVHDIVGAALEQMGEAVQSQPIAIEIEPNLPLVPMDHALIVQVMVNLIDNALKYSPANVPIEIKARRRNGCLLIRVINHGGGIAPQELDRVFEKFFRGSSAAGSRGIGLGLSICKGFVEAHHGRIWAEQRPHGETEIAFSLPLRAGR